MKFPLDFFQALGQYLHAHKLVKKYNLWPYLIIPGVFSLIYITLLILFGASYFWEISDSIVQNWLPGIFMGTLSKFFISFMIWILAFLFIYINYKPVILICFSPLLSNLYEKTESLLYGTTPTGFN